MNIFKFIVNLFKKKKRIAVGQSQTNINGRLPEVHSELVSFNNPIEIPKELPPAFTEPASPIRQQSIRDLARRKPRRLKKIYINPYYGRVVVMYPTKPGLNFSGKQQKTK